MTAMGMSEEGPLLVETSKWVFYKTRGDSVRATLAGLRSIETESGPTGLPECRHGNPEDVRPVLRDCSGGNCGLLPPLITIGKLQLIQV